jgi:F0F1-type ATP synthase assembly protein I
MQDANVGRVVRLLAAQAMLSVGIVVAMGVFFDWQVARDSLVGGLAAVSGSAVFALWLFKRPSSVDPHALVKQFYAGELLRFATIVILFGLAMKKIDSLNPATLLVVFLIVQITPLLLANRIAR